jgi:hypothetical protein
MSGGFQPAGLLGSGPSGSISGATSKATLASQEGPLLGAAPRQPASRSKNERKIDDAKGPVGSRDKQQEDALKQQEQRRAARESRKDKDKGKGENAQPVLPEDGKPSAPTDDEVNAFRDRRQDAPNADFMED